MDNINTPKVKRQITQCDVCQKEDIICYRREVNPLSWEILASFLLENEPDSPHEYICKDCLNNDIEICDFCNFSFKPTDLRPTIITDFDTSEPLELKICYDCYSIIFQLNDFYTLKKDMLSNL